jgi:5'-nucleotidase
VNLLISNDDGVNAAGIIALAECLELTGKVTVVAPDRNRSGSSAALTLDRPLYCHQLANGHYKVTGTPCDCIHLGSHRLMDELPDIVISGINRGANLGDDVIYSGTVAAAMEGRSLGFPAIAVSLVGRDCENYETAAKVVRGIIEQLKVNSLSPKIMLNINVPDIPYESIKGIKLTRLGSRHRADTIVEASDPKGEKVYWIGPPSKPQDIGEGTDFWAVENDLVSITPLVIDLTAHASNDVIEPWLRNFEKTFRE